MIREQNFSAPNLCLYYSSVATPGRVERGPRVGFTREKALVNLEPSINLVVNRVLQERPLCFAVDRPEIVVHCWTIHRNAYRHFVWVSCFKDIRQNPKLHKTRTLCSHLQNSVPLGMHSKNGHRRSLGCVNVTIRGVETPDYCTIVVVPVRIKLINF